MSRMTARASYGLLGDSGGLLKMALKRNVNVTGHD